MNPYGAKTNGFYDNIKLFIYKHNLIMSFRKYTLEQALLAAKESSSIAQMLTKLGLVPNGGNYEVIKRYIKDNNIDISHFTGSVWSKGKVLGPKRPIKDYLDNKFSIQSHKLKCRILREKLLPHQCNFCKNIQWQSKPIPLELHHIDGDKLNNNMKNLELLCPNCHAFTDNYRGKNINRTTS